MPSKANGTSQPYSGPSAQGSAIDAPETGRAGSNVIYPSAFAGGAYANEEPSLYAGAEAIGIGDASNIGNTSQGGTMSELTREEMKEAIGAAEARGETKIARFEGKLDLVLSKLDDVRQDNRTTRANQWVIAFGLALLIVALVASFPSFFGIGSQIRDLVHTEVHDQLPAPASTTRPSNQK